MPPSRFREKSKREVNRYPSGLTLKEKVRGIEIKPLYKTVPEAAKQDPQLYARLALVDALRDGRARERKLAEEELIKTLRTNG